MGNRHRTDRCLRDRFPFEYQEKQRDDFIAAHKESIQRCNERIAELEAKNVGYQESIDLIIVEIEKLEKEIEELKEQK